MNIDNLTSSENLKKEVEKYYPLGTSILSTNSPSMLDDVIKITETKINQLLTDNLPIVAKNLVSEIEKKFKHFTILPEFEKQFPNYSISIQFQRKDIEELTIINSLELRLSLLTEYYTAFYEEKIVHKNSSLHQHTFTPLTTNIRSSKAFITDYQGKYMNTIKQIVTALYPKYSFLSHHLLHKTMISDSVPFGLDSSLSNTGFSVYNFLFDNDFDYLGTTYVTV